MIAMPSMLVALILAVAPTNATRFVTTVQDAYPALSPDGSTLMFQSTRNGRWALYLADADGGNVRVLLDSGDDPVTPSWSADGRRIAFAATIDGQSDIFVIGRDGDGRRRLSDDPGDDSHPHFGTDGRIYFNSARATPDRNAEWSQQHHDIYSVAVDGGDLRRHTDCKTVCTFPSMSPDGRWLVYRKIVATPGRNWEQGEAARNSEVFVAALDGSGERNLSDHPAFDGWPVWSPDGRWIVFASNRDSTPNVGHIYAIRPDGTGLRQLSVGPLSNVQPSFAPDGRSILAYGHLDSAGREAGAIVRWEAVLP